MRGDPSNPEVWLSYALRDYQWAKRDLSQNEPLRAVISLQQAAEKTLKARLVAERYPGDFDEPPTIEEVSDLEVQVTKLIQELFPEALN